MIEYIVQEVFSVKRPIFIGIGFITKLIDNTKYIRICYIV